MPLQGMWRCTLGLHSAQTAGPSLWAFTLNALKAAGGKPRLCAVCGRPAGGTSDIQQHATRTSNDQNAIRYEPPATGHNLGPHLRRK